MGSKEKRIVGNKTLNHRIPEKNVGLIGLVEDKASVVGLMTKEEGSFEEEVDKIGVLVKAKAIKRSVKMLEVFDRGKALKDAILDFQNF